jgi:hypothetical protein
MARKRPNPPEPEVAEQTAHILFLTYGHDAIEMATLRCDELIKTGDKAGSASWKKIRRYVRKLVAANPQEHGTIN